MLSHLIFSLAASAYLCNAEPQISPPDTLTPREATTDCQNTTAGFNDSCWDLIPADVGMKSWLNTWNKTTTTCQPGEMWANCFVRLAGVPKDFGKPVRCDLIGPDVCPVPDSDILANASLPVAYGVASIYALQQYMTSLYQYIGGDEGSSLARNGFLAQSGTPRSVKPILLDILNNIGDPVAVNLTTLITKPNIIGQPSFVIMTEAEAPQVVGQTVGYLLQWAMKEWVAGGFTALAVEGNLISIVEDQGWFY